MGKQPWIISLNLKNLMEILKELDMEIEHPPPHHHTLILLNPYVIPHLLPLNRMSLKLLKLRDLKC